MKTLWVESYRPTNIEEYLCDDDFKNNILRKFISEKSIPHIILHGSAGQGKTTLAKILIKELNATYLYINASEENGINIIREKVKEFAKSSSLSPVKIVFFDEGDRLSPEAQDSLKNMIESYSNKTRFIFTTNKLHGFIEPIISRCAVFEIKAPSKREVAKRLVFIAKSENVKLSMDTLSMIVNDNYPDIRRCIDDMEVNVKDGVCLYVNKSLKFIDNLFDIIENSNNFISKFKEIKDLMYQQDFNYNHLYSELFDKLETKDKLDMSILIVGEYSYYNSVVMDKRINFLTCITKLINLWN